MLPKVRCIMALSRPFLNKNGMVMLNNCKLFCTSSVTKLPQPPLKHENFEVVSFDKAMNIRKNKTFECLKFYYKDPIMITEGKMQYVFDQNGKRYLDMFGGIVTVSVGHCHPKVNEAVIRQMQKLWHVTNIYLHPKLSEYAEKLTQCFPKNLNVCYFVNSGSEANDLALILARVYTGAFDIISLRNSYHGNSPYTMGLTGLSTWKQNFPNGFGIHHAMNPDPYKGLWGGSNCRDSPIQTDRKCACSIGECLACDMYISQLEEVLKYTAPKKIAGFIAESIQGVGGAVVFPKYYLKRAQEIVHKHGGLFISDEVQTGFGRTGTNFWGFQNHNIIPDIVTLAKGIGNGFPLAAVITTKEISKCLNESLMFNTFGGSPLSCAAGSAVLDVMLEEKLMNNCDKVGNYLLKLLAKLREKYEIVGDVRGKGLMIGVEMVKDKVSRDPLSQDVMSSIFEDTKNMSLLIGRGGLNGNVFRIKPPMCITNADADFCANVLETAICNHLKK